MSVQPFTSVTTTTYEPAIILLLLAVLTPLFHWYVYGGGVLPPVTSALIFPVLAPLQSTGSTIEVKTINSSGWDKVYVIVS